MGSRVYDTQDDKQVFSLSLCPGRSHGVGHEAEYPSRWATVCSIAPKIGGSAHTLNERVKKAEVDSGKRAGQPGDAATRMKELERDIAETSGTGT